MSVIPFFIEMLGAFLVSSYATPQARPGGRPCIWYKHLYTQSQVIVPRKFSLVRVLIRVLMICQDLMGFLHYLRETVEPGSSAKWLRPPQVQHILNYKACHSAIRCVVPQHPHVESFTRPTGQIDHDLIDHLVPHLLLWEVVQHLRCTDPTQETCDRSCRLNRSALKDLDLEVRIDHTDHTDHLFEVWNI